MRILTAASLVSLIGCQVPHLERVDEATLRRRVREAAESKAPAVVVGVAWRDGRTLVVAEGEADLSTHRPVGPGTPMAWFSVTKLFTATAVLQLAERGLLDLDAPVHRYLPERHLARGGAEPTIRQLLSHSAGLDNPMPIRWVHLATEPPPGLEAMVDQRIGREVELSWVPGTRNAYSNLGYLLLGLVIERVTGEPYERYVRRQVLEPLGLTGTGYAPTPAEATGYQRSWSAMGLAAPWLLPRRFFGEEVKGYLPLRPFTVDGAPYGGLIGPVPDLLRFGEMVLHDGRAHGGARVLGVDSLQAMLQPQGGSGSTFGLGWRLGRIDGQRFAYHFGGGAGFRSELRVYPDLGYAIAVVATETSFPTERLSRLVVEP